MTPDALPNDSTWVWADGTIYDPALGGYREATPDELAANGHPPEELEQLHGTRIEGWD